MNNDSTEPRDFRSYLRPIRAYWWLILAVVVIVTAGTYVYYSQKARSYEATTELLVQQSPLDQLLLSSNGLESGAVENLALLVTTRTTQQEVHAQFEKEGVTPVAGEVTARPVASSNFIEITATAGSAEGAAQLANTYAVAFVASQSAAVREEANQSIAATEKRLHQIANLEGAGAEAQRASLEERIQTLELVAAQPVRSTGIQQVEAAVPPSSPSGADPISNAFFAFVISLVLGLGAAFGLDYLNRKLTSVEAAEEIFELPVLTEVPRVNEPAPFDQSGIGVAEELHEPFHRLQTNLEMMSFERPMRTILVASAAPGEGKSLVTRNLALAYREAGRKVAVVDADFRKGRVGQLLAAKEGPGFTDILTGRASFDESVQIVQGLAENGSEGNGAAAPERRYARAAAGERGELAIVPAGSHPGQEVPPASSQLRQALQIVPDRYETVIIDSAPLLATADVLPLLSEADGVVLVTRLGVSTRDSVKRLLTELRRVPHINIVGVVVNSIPRRTYRTRAYGYYYGD
jgi:Mrp family chromosome partitioning ATPase/capsular polysaccharide biosynthesis protein